MWRPKNTLKTQSDTDSSSLNNDNKKSDLLLKDLIDKSSKDTVDLLEIQQERSERLEQSQKRYEEIQSKKIEKNKIHNSRIDIIKINEGIKNDIDAESILNLHNKMYGDETNNNYLKESINSLSKADIENLLEIIRLINKFNIPVYPLSESEKTKKYFFYKNAGRLSNIKGLIDDVEKIFFEISPKNIELDIKPNLFNLMITYRDKDDFMKHIRSLIQSGERKRNSLGMVKSNGYVQRMLDIAHENPIFENTFLKLADDFSLLETYLKENPKATIQDIKKFLPNLSPYIN